MVNYINNDELNVLIQSEHRDPHHILGIHPHEDKYYINVYQPYAKLAFVKDLKDDTLIEMQSIRDGFFTVLVDNKINYNFKFTGFDDSEWEAYDPYVYDPIISNLDLYLFGQGTHYEVYEKLGAHPMEIGGIEGVLFAVWAPNAKRVSVIGSFNGWDGRLHQMRQLGGSGIYELFIPDVQCLDKYKYEIKTNENYLIKKSDPYGCYSELRPNTASAVFDINKYIWHDSHWVKKRDSNNPINQPVSIYEVHLGSWKKEQSETGFLNYRTLAHQLVAYVKEMGYTHIELMPVSEYPFDGSWGYQVTGYYAPTSRFGTPEDFMYFVDYCHQNDIGVLLDWVPGHFPKDEHGLIKFDGTALYEHSDPKQGEHPHWGTMIFNYGRNEIKNFLIANAFYWIKKFHIDGLRVDAVASMLYLDYGKEEGEWVPNCFGGRENLDAEEFFKHLNSILYKNYPGIMMVAEESTSWTGVSRPTETGGLGFGYKWNMGWMNDFLRYMDKDPIHRKYHHNDLTFSMVYAFTENFILVLSHDEVVHGKGSMIGRMPGDYWQKFANLRAAYGFMYGHPGKKLLFMGGEFAQFEEWNESKSLDWHLLHVEKHQQLQQYVKDLNYLYKKERAFWTDDFSYKGFEWISCSDAESSIVSFIRKGEAEKDMLVFVCNFTPVPRTLHKIGVPLAGKYEEIMNSDDLKYGGSDVRNLELLETENEEWDGKPYSLGLKVPPLGVTILKPVQS